MRMSLHTRMAIGLVSGVVLGMASFFIFGDGEGLKTFIKYFTQPIGQIFLRLLFMLVLPLIFSALTLGVAGIGDPRRLALSLTPGPRKGPPGPCRSRHQRYSDRGHEAGRLRILA